jgi:hypothetical protein
MFLSHNRLSYVLTDHTLVFLVNDIILIVLILSLIYLIVHHPGTELIRVAN